VDWLRWFGTGLLITDWVIRIAIVSAVMARRRHVSASLAWIAVVLFLPIVGLVAYLLVGESRLGRRRAHRYHAAAGEVQPAARALWTHRFLDWTGERERYRSIARYGLAAAGSPPVSGNRVELIAESDGFLSSLARDIDEAQHHVHLQTYIFQPGEATGGVVGALERAAGRGVTCRVLADAVGSKHFFRSALPGRLRDAGVLVEAALPANPLRMLFARIDVRNHRKVAVIDSRLAYAGSQNLAGPEFAANVRVGPWVDATLRMQGPAAHALQSVFLCDWLVESDAPLDPPSFFPEIDEAGDSVVQIVPSGLGLAPHAIHESIMTTIYSARDELVMTTPYFVPGEEVVGALKAAAMRGVAVTLVMPARVDAPLVRAAGFAYYHELLETGITIRHYRPGMLHSKTITVDHELAAVGSANFDLRSFMLNFEVTTLVYDSDFASLLRTLQQRYIDESDEVELDRWRRRAVARRVADNAAQLVAPLL